MLRSEASLVSPHGRCLVMSCSRSFRTALRRARRAPLERGLSLRSVPCVGHFAVRPDQECRALDAHRFLAVIVLLDPRPVAFRNGKIFVGEENKVEPVLRLERSLAADSELADSPD